MIIDYNFIIANIIFLIHICFLINKKTSSNFIYLEDN